MIAITIVIIIAFGWFFTPGNRKNAPASDFRIYGHNYSREQLERQGRSFGVAAQAGLNELIFGLTLGNPQSQRAGSDYVLNSFVLAHEVRRLGITVDDAEIAAAIEKLPVFQANGAYDPAKYRLFEENALKPRGFNAGRLEELVRDQIALKKVLTLLGSTVEVTPAEFRAAYVQQHQKMHISVIRFDRAGFKAAIKPTDEEIAKVYQEREKTFTAPEKRTVSFVNIDLSATAKALSGKELMDARQALANRANEFNQEIAKENAQFAEVAKKYGLEVKTARDFTESEPSPELASVPEAAAIAFKLTEQDAASEPLPVGNGYCILHLDKITPSRQLTLEEARPAVIEQIQTERGNDALVASANAARAKIIEELKAGKPFADAAAAAGQKVESLPVFSLSNPPEDKPEIQEAAPKAVELADGELSEVVPGASGGMIVYMEKRDPVDEAQMSKDEQEQIGMIRQRKALIAFVEWLQGRQKLAYGQPQGRGE